MGHSSPAFTKDIYIEDTVIIYDAVEEIEDFISEISNPDSQEPEESIDDVNAMAEEYFL